MEKELIHYKGINGVTIFEKKTSDPFPSHWHNDAEFILILMDGCKFKVKDEIISPKSGDILLVWPRELHEILHVPKGSSIFVQFSSSLIESNLDLVSASGLFKKHHLINAKKDPEVTAGLTEKIYKIWDIYNKKLHFAETRCKQLVYDMLLLIGNYVLENQRDQDGDERFSGKTWEYIKAAYSFIAEHSTEDISQADVASQIGLSPYYFSKLFNEYTEMSFPAYLSHIRLHNAISLLTDDNMSITECAFMAGFQSTTTFNKVFQDMVGCSPREYRKLHTNDEF
jgi:AraC-like DNA-binding protein